MNQADVSSGDPAQRARARGTREIESPPKEHQRAPFGMLPTKSFHDVNQQPKSGVPGREPATHRTPLIGCHQPRKGGRHFGRASQKCPSRSINLISFPVCVFKYSSISEPGGMKQGKAANVASRILSLGGLRTGPRTCVCFVLSTVVSIFVASTSSTRHQSIAHHARGTASSCW
jgi:hypothetical protein